MNDAVRRTYWQLTATLLAAHFAGSPDALPAAIALNTVQALHFLARHRRPGVLEVQVRLLYLGMMLVATFVPALRALLLLQFAGLCIRLCLNYCLAARLLLLMPWNRSTPLSWQLARRILLSPPSIGGPLMLGEPPAPAGRAAPQAGA